MRFLCLIHHVTCPLSLPPPIFTSSLRSRSDKQRNKKNKGNAKRNLMSRNSNKFKGIVGESTSITDTTLMTPGIKRKVKQTSNDPPSPRHEREGENLDDWMKDMSPEDVMFYLNEAQPHLTPRNSLPPSHESRSNRGNAVHDSSVQNSESSASHLPQWSLRRIVIDGSNVAMAHGKHKVSLGTSQNLSLPHWVE